VGELKACAMTLTGAKAVDDLEDSLPLKLLADERLVWMADAIHMGTESLLERLKGISDSPWAEFEFTARRLAKFLRPFGARSRQIRVGTDTMKGYLRTELEEAYVRYLSPSETSDTTAMDKDETGNP
jgi:hypothetical protein